MTNKEIEIKIEKNQNELSIYEWVVAIGNEKLIIFNTFLLIITVAIVYILLMTPTFTAKSTIITSGQQSQGTSNISSLATLSNLTGIAGAGIKSQEEVFVALLNSDTVMDGVIRKLKIEEVSKTRMLSDIRQSLKGSVKIFIDKKSNFINIEVNNSDPILAARIANTLVEELTLLLGRIALDSAQKRISFYERAIEKTQSELLSAKNSFREYKENSGVISFSGMTENIYSQIASKELQISAMSHFSTKQNPEILRLDAELSALREQLFKSEQYNSKNEIKDKTSQKAAIDSYREIKSLEMILGILTSQFKTSVLEAYSSNPFVQQLEVASAPERRSKPQRTILVGYSAIIGLVSGLLIAIFRIKTKLLLKDEKYNSIILDIKKSWFSMV